MLHPRATLRRLLLEQLTERIAFHAGEVEPDSALMLTPDGHAYYYDPPLDPAVVQSLIVSQTENQRLVNSAPLPKLPTKIDLGSTDDQFHVMDGPSNLNVPIYHSNASFSKKIYLDFDGQVVTGTWWNGQNYTGSYNTGATINAPAFSLDGDFANFDSTELALIQEVWARVSEDYAPFQVDVTTEEPPLSQFTAGSEAMRVIISTNIDATTGQQWFPAAGGVAYLDSWTATNGTPCWVFYNYMFGYAKYFADAASHEVGHTFNLGHDGRTSPVEEYYSAHGSGATRWGPIMGSGYQALISQWSKGEYTAASNAQDDLATINSKLAYINDDHGDTNATATQLNVGTASNLAVSGLITTRTDVDAIRFATQAGSITLNVDPFDYATNKADLDAKITLLDSAGTTVASVDNVDVINSTLTINVAKGFYTLLVDGAGRPAISGDEGYSDYGSIGRYTVSGTIIANAAPTVVNDSAALAASSSVLIDVLGNDMDANNDLLSILSVGTPASGTAVIEAGKIRYTAAGAAGQVVFAYTAVDELGLSASGHVTVTINGTNSAPTISDVLNTTTNEDTPTSALNFTVGDGETAVADLTVSGSSSNTALVPNANIVLGGSGANRTVTITPLPNQSGTATITITVTDAGAGTASDTFVLTVNPINDAPSDIGLSASTVTENLFGGNIGNLTVTDPDVGDAHTFTVDDTRFEVVAGVLKLKPGNSLNYESSATVNVNVTAKDLANSQFSQSFTITVIDLPEMIGGAPVLGDGTAQRSMMQKITVTLDGAVTISSGAFTVIQRGPSGGAVTTTATPVVNGSGQTVVTLTFSGAFTRGAGVLADGYYQLTIDGTKIVRAGQQLDINGDGVGGDTYRIGTREADNFFSLYGDTDGDGLVGVTEFGQFRIAFGKSVGQPGYNGLFDYDGDAAVGISDFGQFRSRFGKPKMPFQQQ